MTDLRTPLSRRRLFTLTAGGASALLISQAAQAAPTLQPAYTSKLRKALTTVPGDLQMPAHVRALAEKALERAKIAVSGAIARPEEFKHDKVAEAGLKFMSSLKPARAQKLVAQTTKLQMSKKFKLQLRPFEAVTHQLVEVEKKKPTAKLPEPKWKGPLVKKLEFHINQVTCIKETNDHTSGSDEILLGGEFVEPNGTITPIGTWKVHDDFDANETVHYDYQVCKAVGENNLFAPKSELCPNGSPTDPFRGRLLASSTIDLAKFPFPSTHSVLLVMAEQDEGGFGKLLQDLYKALKNEIDAELASVGALIGGALGSVFPGLGNAIGAAIGAALAWAVGEFIGWLAGLLQDDLIAAQHWTIQLPSPEVSAIQALGQSLPAPAGVWASPLKKLTFAGDGGRYEAQLHWRAFA
jgi:hypothetical protein